MASFRRRAERFVRDTQEDLEEFIESVPPKLQEGVDFAMELPKNAQEWGRTVWENQEISGHVGDILEAGGILAQDPELYELAYKAAQARIKWSGGEKDFNKKRFSAKDLFSTGRTAESFKGVYEKTWHETALWLLGTAALGDRRSQEEIEGQKHFEREPDLREELRKETAMALLGKKIDLPFDPANPVLADLRLNKIDYRSLYGPTEHPQVDRGVGEAELLIQRESRDLELLEGLSLPAIIKRLQDIDAKLDQETRAHALPAGAARTGAVLTYAVAFGRADLRSIAELDRLRTRAQKLRTWVQYELGRLPDQTITWKQFKRNRINQEFSRLFDRGGITATALSVLDSQFAIVLDRMRINLERKSRSTLAGRRLPMNERAKWVNDELARFAVGLRKQILDWERIQSIENSANIEGAFKNIDEVRKLQFGDPEFDPDNTRNLIYKDSKAMAEFRSRLLGVTDRFVGVAITRTEVAGINEGQLASAESNDNEKDARETIKRDNERWAKEHEATWKKFGWVRWATDINDVIAKEKGAGQELTIHSQSDKLLDEVQARIDKEIKESARITVGTLWATHDHMQRAPHARHGIRYQAMVHFREGGFAAGPEKSFPITIEESQARDLLRIARGEDLTLRTLEDKIQAELTEDLLGAGIAVEGVPLTRNQTSRMTGLTFSRQELQAMAKEAIRAIADQIKLQELFGDEREPKYEVAVEEESSEEGIKPERWNEREFDNYIQEASEFMSLLQESMRRAGYALSIDASGQITETIPWADGSIFKTQFDAAGNAIPKTENRKRFEARLFRMLAEMEGKARIAARRLRDSVGIRDAKVIWGAVACTFDSRYITREEVEKVAALNARGAHLGGGENWIGLIAIDINPGRYTRPGETPDTTLRHELQHQLVVLNDSLLSMDKRLGMGSAFRRPRYGIVLDQGVPVAGKETGKSFLGAIQGDADRYSLALGREFDLQKDPERVLAQQGYLEELSAALVSGKTDWLYLDNAEQYSARNSKDLGTPEQLVGNHETDIAAVKSLITTLQGCHVMELTRPIDWNWTSLYPNMAVYQQEVKGIWEKALGILGTARTVVQADRLIKELWNNSQFKRDLDADHAAQFQLFIEWEHHFPSI